MNTTRLDSLKNELFYVTPEISSERARLITESYRATKSLPTIIRRAKALEYLLEKRTIFVRPGELLVGAVSSKSRGGEIYPEYGLDIEPELDEIPKRALDRYIISETTKRELREVFQYWRDHEVVQGEYQLSLLKAVMPQEVFDRGILADHRCRRSEGEGHLVPNFERLMKTSLVDVANEAVQRQEELADTFASHPENVEKHLFLEAVQIVCRAAINYAKRYATLLWTLAEVEIDSARQSELKEMAEICDGLYVSPAETFRQAIQYITLTIAILNIECSGVSVAPGRVDQYLYPYYKRDIEEARLSREGAVELCTSLLINGNSYCILRPWVTQRWQTGYKGGLGNPTLGGQLSDVFSQIEAGGANSSKSADAIKVGVSMLPHLPRDAGDRNRTSPFAFTGNKFEFRAVGSSQSVAGANTVLNAAVAESLDYMAGKLEAASAEGADLNAAVQELLAAEITAFKPVLFDGDNYSDEWKAEAARRGLPNLVSTVDCVPLATTPETIELFEKYGVYSARELHSRQEILLENYSTTLAIEAQTLLMMAHTMVLPAGLKYQATVATAVNAAKAAGAEDAVQTDLLKEVVGAVSALRSAANALDKAAAESAEGALAEATRMHDTVIPAMNAVRTWADTLELLVDDGDWPLPTYREMLFIR